MASSVLNSLAAVAIALYVVESLGVARRLAETEESVVELLAPLDDVLDLGFGRLHRTAHPSG